MDTFLTANSLLVIIILKIQGDNVYKINAAIQFALFWFVLFCFFFVHSNEKIVMIN